MFQPKKMKEIEMVCFYSSNIPYEPVMEEDFPVEETTPVVEKRDSKCSKWCTRHINLIASLLVAGMCLVVVYICVTSLPIFHKTEPKETDALSFTTTGMSAPLSGVEETSTDGMISTTASLPDVPKTGTVGKSRVMQPVESSTTILISSPWEVEDADSEAAVLIPNSMESDEDNLISAVGLVNFGIVDSKNVENLSVSFARELPSNASNYDPIDLLRYMKYKPTFKEIQCVPQRFPVYMYSVTVMDRVFYGKGQSKSDAKQSAARVATAALFDVNYGDQLEDTPYTCI